MSSHYPHNGIQTSAVTPKVLLDLTLACLFNYTLFCSTLYLFIKLQPHCFSFLQFLLKSQYLRCFRPLHMLLHIHGTFLSCSSPGWSLPGLQVSGKSHLLQPAYKKEVAWLLSLTHPFTCFLYNMLICFIFYSFICFIFAPSVEN